MKKKKGDVLKSGKLQTLFRKAFQYVSGIPHQVPFPYRFLWSPAGLPFVPPTSPETKVFWCPAAASILQQPWTLENTKPWNPVEQRRCRGSDLPPGARGFHHVLCQAWRIRETHLLLPFLIIVTECLTAFYRKRGFQLRICGSALENAYQAEPSLWQCGLEAWPFPILVS